MRTARLAFVATMLAGLGLDHDPVSAQEPGQQISPEPLPPPVETTDSEAYTLPEVVIESAPAKRNKKKEALRATSGVDTAAGESSPALPQQVVEGEKTLRTVRDTTTSVSVITSQDIAERQISDLDEAIGKAPNVLTSEDANAGFVIRGMNSEGQLGLQHIAGMPLVGIVIDGMSQSSDAARKGARALWDVDQVEVLRGPQSTLQGRNALGGSVIVHTNDPTYKLGGVVEGTIGTNDLYGVGFVLNSPIVPGQSAFRISGYKTDRDRDISYSDPNNQQLGIDAYDTLRGKLLIEPDSLPGFSALFTIARTHDRPGSGQVSGPDFLARHLEDTDDFTDFRKGTADNYIADLSYEFQPGMTLHSVTAYARTRSTVETGPNAAFSRYGDNTDGKDFTQDLRLEIANSGNGLSGVFGLFYGSFERDNYGKSTAVLEYFYGPGYPSDPLVYGEGGLVAQTTSIAAYADLRYRWNRWNLIAGGRLLRDVVETQEDVIIDQTAYLDDHSSSKATFNEFLPKAGVTYDLTRNETVGFTYTKGYRAGFQQLVRGFGFATYSTEVDPEYVDNYELSYRSNWLNNTLQFNANAFYNDYTDQQVAVLNANYSVSEIINAGSSHSYGAEFEARWRPIPTLQIYGTLGLLKTEYDEIEIKGVDQSGNEYPEAPAYTISAGAMYRSPAGWFAGADVRHTDGYYSYGDIANLATRYVDSYTVVDARVGMEWEDYTLTLFAKNLFDEDYVTAINRVDGGLLNPDYAFIGDSRTVGVTLRAEF